MPKLVYVGGSDAVTVPGVGVAWRGGDPVDVPDDIAAGLIERGDFKSATKPRPSAKEE